jgi:hypothetical protein
MSFHLSEFCFSAISQHGLNRAIIVICLPNYLHITTINDFIGFFGVSFVRNAIAKLKDYQKRCNTFFMDVVSQLCFADNTAPSQEVVDKLLSYIFFTTRGGDHQRTRDLSIFNTGIDPTPVFRSFLLQLLMRTRYFSQIFDCELNSSLLLLIMSFLFQC